MPIESHIDERLGRVVVTVSGAFSIEEIVDTIDRSVRDPAYRRGFTVISDHTGVEVPLTATQARRMVDRLEALREFLVGTRWAVITSNPASYGMLRMVSVLAERVPLEVRVFGSHEEADAWLGSSATDE